MQTDTTTRERSRDPIRVPITYDSSTVLGYRNRSTWMHLLWDRDVDIDPGPDPFGGPGDEYLHVDAHNPLDGPAPTPADMRYRVRCRWEPGGRYRIPGHGLVRVGTVRVGMTGGQLCWVIFPELPHVAGTVTDARASVLQMLRSSPGRSASRDHLSASEWRLGGTLCRCEPPLAYWDGLKGGRDTRLAITAAGIAALERWEVARA